MNCFCIPKNVNIVQWVLKMLCTRIPTSFNRWPSIGYKCTIFILTISLVYYKLFHCSLFEICLRIMMIL